MPLTRIVRRPAAAGLIVFGLLAAGCGQSGNQKAGGSQPADNPTVNVPNPAGGPGQFQPTPVSAGTAAAMFLKALGDGQAAPAQLAAGFKKVIAEPVFESDKAAGFSESAAGDWLKALGAGAKFEPTGIRATVGDAAILTGGVTGAGSPGRFGLRVVKAGDGWQVDWLHRTAAPAGPGPQVSDGDATFAKFAAQAFLDTVLSGNDALAESLLTPAAKAKLAPPEFESHKVLGYNRSKLRQIVLRDFRADSTGYTLTKLAPADGGFVATGDLTKGDTKKPFTLKLTKGTGPGEWLIADLSTE
jgi:hypothetical protein